MRSHPYQHLAAGFVALSLALTFDDRTSVACGNAIFMDSRDWPIETSHSEGALADGRAGQAVAGILRIYPKVREGALPKPIAESDTDLVYPRAMRVIAVAIVRTEGLVRFWRESESASSDHRRARLEWAISLLRQMILVKSTPSLETDLGEALSKLPETRREALSLLDGLDKKDLVTSPHGFAALAELRGEAGDNPGAEAARKRFEALINHAVAK
jgi:hypothetical protein